MKDSNMDDDPSENIYVEYGGTVKSFFYFTAPFVKFILRENELVIKIILCRSVVLSRKDIRSITIQPFSRLCIQHRLSNVDSPLLFISCDIENLMSVLVNNNWISIEKKNTKSVMLEDNMTKEQKYDYRDSTVIKTYLVFAISAIVLVPMNLIYMSIPFSFFECTFFVENIIKIMMIPWTIVVVVFSLMVVLFFKLKHNRLTNVCLCFLSLIMPVSTFWNIKTLAYSKQKCSIELSERLRKLSNRYMSAGLIGFIITIVFEILAFKWGNILDGIESSEGIYILFSLPFLFPLCCIIASFYVRKRIKYQFCQITLFMLSLFFMPLGSLLALFIGASLFDEDVKRLFYKKEV